MITIIDYGAGNIGSIQNMLNHLGIASTLARTGDDMRDVERVILPGVGAWDSAMNALKTRGLDEAIQEVARQGVPTLGVCLGMQVLTDASEEGTLPGLGLIRGSFQRIAGNDGLRVPHMGWAYIREIRHHHLFEQLERPARFYFAHSFTAIDIAEQDIIATAIYGSERVACFARANIIGTQFHPEKSHAYGMQLLKNFTTWRP